MDLLAIDIGNSRTKLGLFHDAVLAACEHLTTASASDAGDWVRPLREVAPCGASEWNGPVAICSSAGAATAGVVAAFCAACPRAAPYVIGPDTAFGMAVHYDPPSAVGRDRLANALAARSLFDVIGCGAIVVDFGTATTFDVVDAAGDFAGGAIAPGIGPGLEALLHGAAHLPNVLLERPEPPTAAIARSTPAAVRSGVMIGHAAMVDGMIERMAQELGSNPIVVATGGWAWLVTSIANSLSAAHRVDELTLHGIRAAWVLNHTQARV